MQEIVEVECGSCGILFGIASRRHAELRESGETFYCPNGHPRVYRDGPKDKKIAELQRERDGLMRDRAERLQLAFERERELLELARRCPICGERTSHARIPENITARLGEHLQDEHGARARLRALEMAKDAETA